MLQPVPEADAVMAGPSNVHVQVEAVPASPALTPHEIDLLSHLYTVLRVRVRNDAGRPVALNPSRAILYDQTGTPWLALDESQRAGYRRWPPWSLPVFFREQFFGTRIAQLEKKLNVVTLPSEWMGPGDERTGLLLFQPIPESVCRHVVLEWSGWRVEREEQGKTEETELPTIRISLQCR
jgi:hypothetical protein